MKLRTSYLPALLCIFMSLTEMKAQYGYGNNYYGRGQSTIPQAEDPEKKEEPMTADEIVAKEMPAITEALELNEFEHAVVSTILTKYVQQTIELRLLKPEPEKLREGMEKIRENQKAELEAGLPEEKFKALLALQENGFKKKKEKKKKGKKPKS